MARRSHAPMQHFVSDASRVIMGFVACTSRYDILRRKPIRFTVREDDHER